MSDELSKKALTKKAYAVSILVDFVAGNQPLKASWFRDAEDLEDIRRDSEESVNLAEGVTGTTGEPRRLFDLAVQEFENGSLRESEQNFRLAKTKAQAIQTH